MEFRKCQLPDDDNPKYRCPSVAMEGYDQCLRHHQGYVEDLEEKLRVMTEVLDECTRHYYSELVLNNKDATDVLAVREKFKLEKIMAK